MASSRCFANDRNAHSIIAVHGLNPWNKNAEEHALDTWRTPAGDGGRLWLRDKLPQKIPDARIFLYKYDSTAVYSQNRKTFVDKVNGFLEEVRLKRIDTPRRPLLLLGHSLGGLLIKQALVNAYSNEKYQDIKLATQGVVFFATPHNGGRGSVVSIRQTAAKIAISLGIKKGDNILEALEEGSMFSDLMDEQWKHRLLDYPIVFFWGAFDRVSRIPLIVAGRCVTNNLGIVAIRSCPKRARPSACPESTKTSCHSMPTTVAYASLAAASRTGTTLNLFRATSLSCAGMRSSLVSWSTGCPMPQTLGSKLVLPDYEPNPSQARAVVEFRSLFCGPMLQVAQG